MTTLDTLSGKLHVTGQNLLFIDLPDIFGDQLKAYPMAMRIIIENALRNAPEEAETLIAAFRGWLETGTSTAEIAFYPSRLLMHDTTCVPALVDMAALRSELAEAGIDPARLNPGLKIDVSTDHSIAVDAYGSADALRSNVAKEIERNAERYRLLKWATGAFDNLRVHPPGTGIMHTINMEQLATVATIRQIGAADWAVPDTLIGTDSHTPMVNGMGVLGWGVGGIEAESVMFGMPVMLRIPDIVGVRLLGKLQEGATATDLALAVTQALRRHGISGEFVEFFGPGVSTLSVGDRAVVANMAPEYGASSGYFPIDTHTIGYLAATGRMRENLHLVEALAVGQGLWFEPEVSPRYTSTLDIDLSQIKTSLAGPRRPQDRIAPAEMRPTLEKAYGRALGEARDGEVPDGAIAIAAITSCTNTTDPRLLVAAGLVARKARRFGLKPPQWVKTSLAPGSPAAGRYLRRTGLLDDLSATGFDIVGFGCTTCIGNSGALTPDATAAAEKGTMLAAVLSGNRNFPGRIHPQIEAGYLASPPLVVAYALAGSVKQDITAEPIGHGPDGAAVFLHDLWPSSAEIDAMLVQTAEPGDFSAAFTEATANKAWAGLQAPDGVLFPWDEASTYVRRPPFVSFSQKNRLGNYAATPLLILGDDITTDHISPAGQIPLSGAAGHYLTERGEDPQDLNVFASRRGNWEAMLRGLFTNPTLRNLIDEALPAGTTRHAPSGDIVPLMEAAARYERDGVSTVILAGERYGTGSSRDWAAKGLALLGVRAVLASSFERIHRSNLIGMGILPVLLPPDITSRSLADEAPRQIGIDAAPETLRPRGTLFVAVEASNGTTFSLDCRLAIETELEIATLRAGGILPSILTRIAAEEGAAQWPQAENSR